MVENMSFFVCPHCGAREDIFGSGGAKERAEQLQIPFLGQLPLLTDLRGWPTRGNWWRAWIARRPKPYLQSIAHTLVSNLAAQRRRSPRLPTLPVIG